MPDQPTMPWSCSLGHTTPEDDCGWCVHVPQIPAGGTLESDPCPGCGHGQAWHARGFCVHPRSIRPCSCSGGYYR